MAQVVALKPGFYAGQRRRTGDVFDMTVKEGSRLPKWVKVVQNPHEARREAEAAKKAEVDKQKAGAVAASGGKAAKEKNASIAQQLAG